MQRWSGKFIRPVTLVTMAAGRTVAQEVADEPATTSLSALHDIVVPEAVPFWPPAPGWYVIGLLVLLSVVGWLVAWRRRANANRYRRAALVELDSIKAGAINANRLSALIKRVALVAWPRAEVASRTGNPWWKFVGSTGIDKAFPEKYGVTLDRLAYGPPNAKSPSEEEIAAAIKGVEGWIRDHRGPGED